MYEYALSAAKKFLGFFLLVSILALKASAQTPEEVAAKAKRDKENAEKAKATEVYSPVPKIVTPGKTDAEPHQTQLFYLTAKTDLWRAEGPDTTKAAGWKVHDHIMTVDKKAKGIITKQRFVDYQLHAEFRIPENITGSGQARGTAGFSWLVFPTAGRMWDMSCRCWTIIIIPPM
jgi:hypothetical protein